MNYDELISNLPEVEKPKRRLSFNDKLKWTGIVLVLYYALGKIPLYGLSPGAEDYFKALRAIVAGKFGSIITLGISPIVTASIILQLLVGVEILPFDINTADGRRKFQGTQKLLTILLTLFEAIVYVMSGGLPPASSDTFTTAFLITQLFIGGILILLLDEVVSKWGFGSGVSLFIAAGVSATIIVGTLNPMGSAANPDQAAGILWSSLKLFAEGDPGYALDLIMPVIFTFIVFVVAVYAQAMKIEIPLSVARVRGYTTKWPLRFIYTSNIPVILAAAVLANLQLWARILSKRGIEFLGSFQGDTLTGGIAFFIQAPHGLVNRLLVEGGQFLIAITGITGTAVDYTQFWFYRLFSDISGFINSLFDPAVATNLLYACPSTSVLQNLGYTGCVFIGDGALGEAIRAFFYVIFLVLGSVLFSIFWVRTSNMDSRSVAKQIQNANMQIRGFRQDPRMLERLLDRYIPSLTVLGGAFVGALAAFADLTNSLGGGTGLLLTVMIVYNLYEEIHSQHMMDMFPALRRFIKG